MLKNKRNLSILFMVLAFVFLVSFVYKGSSEDLLKTSETNLFNLGNCETSDMDKIQCLSHQVDKLNFPISDEDLYKVYKNLNELEEGNLINSLVCHLVSHKIGEQSLKSNLDIFTLMSVNLYTQNYDYTCANGYYHGIMMGYLKRYTNLNEKTFVNLLKGIVRQAEAQQIDNTRRDNFFHSLGHSIYNYANNDVEKSLRICNEVLADNNAGKNLCFYGVYMQMSFDMQEVGLNTPIDYCVGVKEEFKNSCFAGVRFDSKYIIDNIHNYQKICESEAKDSVKLTCIKNYILQFSGRDIDTTNVYKFCSLLKDKRLSDICYFYYPKTYKILYNENKDTKNLLSQTCDKLSILDEIKCKKIFFSDSKIVIYLESDPKDVFIPRLDISDIKYLFK